MKQTLPLLAALLLSPLAALHAADAPTKSRSVAKTAGGNPNILFILTDDEGLSDVGWGRAIAYEHDRVPDDHWP